MRQAGHCQKRDDRPVMRQSIHAPLSVRCGRRLRLRDQAPCREAELPAGEPARSFRRCAAVKNPVEGLVAGNAGIGDHLAPAAFSFLGAQHLEIDDRSTASAWRVWPFLVRGVNRLSYGQRSLTDHAVRSKQVFSGPDDLPLEEAALPGSLA